MGIETTTNYVCLSPQCMWFGGVVRRLGIHMIRNSTVMWKYDVICKTKRAHNLSQRRHRKTKSLTATGDVGIKFGEIQSCGFVLCERGQTNIGYWWHLHLILQSWQWTVFITPSSWSWETDYQCWSTDYSHTPFFPSYPLTLLYTM